MPTWTVLEKCKREFFARSTFIPRSILRKRAIILWSHSYYIRSIVHSLVFSYFVSSFPVFLSLCSLIDIISHVYSLSHLLSFFPVSAFLSSSLSVWRSWIHLSLETFKFYLKIYISEILERHCSFVNSFK